LSPNDLLLSSQKHGMDGQKDGQKGMTSRSDRPSKWLNAGRGVGQDLQTVVEKLGPGWDIVTWTVMATNAAADRLGAVSLHDPHLAYAAAGETLFWIRGLDQQLERYLGTPYISSKERDPVIKRQLLGLKHARDRITHAFDVLETVEFGGNRQDQGYGSPGFGSGGRWPHPLVRVVRGMPSTSPANRSSRATWCNRQ
jgi:hypothetical protein